MNGRISIMQCKHAWRPTGWQPALRSLGGVSRSFSSNEIEAGLLGGGNCSPKIDPRNSDLVKAQGQLSHGNPETQQLAMEYMTEVEDRIRTERSPQPYLDDLDSIPVSEIQDPLHLAVKLKDCLLDDMLWASDSYVRHRWQIFSLLRKYYVLHHVRTIGQGVAAFTESRSHFSEALKEVFSRVKAQDDRFPESSLLAELSVVIGMIKRTETEFSQVCVWTKLVVKAINASYDRNWSQIIEVLEVALGKATEPSFNPIGLLTVIDHLQLKSCRKLLTLLLQPASHKNWKTLVIALTWVETLYLRNQLNSQTWLPKIKELVKVDCVRHNDRVREKVVTLLILFQQVDFLEIIKSRGTVPRVIQLVKQQDTVLDACGVSMRQKVLRPPEKNPLFVGRGQELRDIETRLALQPVVVLGRPGMGKRSLVAKYVDTHQLDYSYVLWVDASSERSVLASFKKIGVVMGLEETDPEILISCIRSKLQEGPHLIIFENAEDDTVIANRFTATSSVLITTCAQRWPDTYSQIVVGPLLEDDAVELFQQRVRRPMDEAVVLAILKQVAFSPLGIIQVSTYLARHSSQSVAVYLCNLQEIIKQIGDEEDTGVRSSIIVQLSDVTQPLEKELLQLFSVVHPEDVPKLVYHSALSVYLEREVNDAELRIARRALEQQSLLKVGPKNDVSLHPLIAGAITPENPNALVRVWVVAFTRVLDSLESIPDEATQFELFASIERQAYKLVNAEYAGVPGLPDLAVRVFDWAKRLLGCPSEVAASELLKRLGCLQQCENSFRSLGELYLEQGEIEQALASFSAALSLCRKTVGYHNIRAAALLYRIGTLHETNDKLEEALGCYHQALSLYYRSVRNKHLGAANILHQIGTVVQAQGRIGNALSYYQQALAIKSNILGVTHLSTARTQCSIAIIYQARGRASEALKLFRQVLPIYHEKLGAEHIATADVLHNLGLASDVTGYLTSAIFYYSQALDIYRDKLGEIHLCTANCYQNMAVVFQMQQLLDDALDYYSKALAIYDKWPESCPKSRADSLSGIGTVCRMQGRLEEATSYLEQALSIYRETLDANHFLIGSTLHNLAGVMAAQEQFEAALSHYDQVILIYRYALGLNHPSMANTFNNIATVFRKQGRLEFALNYYEKALSIFQQSLGRHHISTAKVLYNIATLLEEQGRKSEAMSYYNTGTSIILEKLPNDSASDNASEIPAGLRLEEARESYKRTMSTYLEGLRQSSHPPDLTQ